MQFPLSARGRRRVQITINLDSLSSGSDTQEQPVAVTVVAFRRAGRSSGMARQTRSKRKQLQDSDPEEAGPSGYNLRTRSRTAKGRTSTGPARAKRVQDFSSSEEASSGADDANEAEGASDSEANRQRTRSARKRAKRVPRLRQPEATPGTTGRRSRSKFVEGGGNRSGDDVTDEEGSDFIVSDDEVEYEEEDGAGSQSDSSKQGQSASEAEDADEASEDEDRPAPQQAKRAPQQAKQAARRKQPSRHQPEQQQPAAAAQEEEDSDTQQQAKRPARGRRASQIVESSDEEEADLDQLASGTEPGNAAAQRKRRRLVQAVDTVPVAAHLEVGTLDSDAHAGRSTAGKAGAPGLQPPAARQEGPTLNGSHRVSPGRQERPDVVVLGGDADGEEAVAQTAQAGTSAGSSRRRHTVLSESEEEEGAGRPENSQDNSDEEQPAPWRRRRVVEEAADGDEERPAATPSRPRRRAAAKETPLSARERIRRATQAAFEEDGRASQDEAESDGERSGSGGEEGAAEAGAPEDNDEDLAGFIVEDDEGAPELPEELRPIPNDPRALFDIYVESLLDNCLGLGWRYGSEDTQRRYERAEQRIAGRLWECRSQLQGLGWVSAAEKGQIFADFKRLPGMWNAWQQATSKADEDEHHAEGPEYEDKCMVCGRHCGRHRKLEVFGREHGRPGAWRESCVFRVGRACAASMVLYHALSHYPTRLMARLKREAKTVLQYHKEASKEEVVDDIMNNTSLMNWLWRNYTALEQVAVQFQMKHARQDRAPFAKRVTKIVTDLHEDPEAEESDPQFSRRARRTPRTGRASEEGDEDDGGPGPGHGGADDGGDGHDDGGDDDDDDPAGGPGGSGQRAQAAGPSQRHAGAGNQWGSQASHDPFSARPKPPSSAAAAAVANATAAYARSARNDASRLDETLATGIFHTGTQHGQHSGPEQPFDPSWPVNTTGGDSGVHGQHSQQGPGREEAAKPSCSAAGAAASTQPAGQPAASGGAASVDSGEAHSGRQPQHAQHAAGRGGSQAQPHAAGTPPSGPGGGVPANACFHCRQPGHWARDCPNRSPPGNCFRCKQPGHWARDCPQAQEAQQTRLPNIAPCSKCGYVGHFARDCHR